MLLALIGLVSAIGYALPQLGNLDFCRWHGLELCGFCIVGRHKDPQELVWHIVWCMLIGYDLLCIFVDV